LSTIGGWFGGNAMLGSAILNGISLGTAGGMGSWGALNAGQKALVLGATAATAIDGIAIVSKSKTEQLEWRVVLPVPRDLADDRTRALLDALTEANKEVYESSSRWDAAKGEQVPGSPKSEKLLEAERTLAAAKARHKAATEQINDELARVLKLGDSNRTTVLMAVVAQNSGRSADFRTLLERIKLAPLKRRSYLDFLRAIAALQAGRVTEAERLLRESWKAANFATEPPILLAGVVGSRGFAPHESKIDEIVSNADKNFKPNAYMTSASLVSLHYRIGTMALGANRCERALAAFTKAQTELSTVEKYWSGKEIRNLLEIGEANALHCQGNKAEAHEIFKKVWERTSGKDARELLCVQYSGGCAR
jgi:tetratricopeptide (TPR) repeat protein